jgi:16S rRNA (uracil1498-N3)-methyltransferase
MATLHRLYLPVAFSPAAILPCSQPQAHYLRSVLRLSDGAELEVFNGVDGAWRASLQAVGKKDAQLQLATAARAPLQPVPDVWLICAPLRQNRLDMLVEKATELGVAKILPVLTQRCSVRQVNVERLRQISIEAAEQCGRDAIAEIAPLTSWADLLGNWDTARPLLMADETGHGKPATEVLKETPLPLAVAIGPEGGWTPEELALANQFASVRKISLGPRILRAETAGIAALSVVLASVGDWAQAPRFGQE